MCREQDARDVGGGSVYFYQNICSLEIGSIRRLGPRTIANEVVGDMHV